MSKNNRFNPEHLRPPEHVFEPDPRSLLFVTHDPISKVSRPIRPEDQHRFVSKLVLHEAVPQHILIQFETAKNLYLYAWFVYRFYPIAAQQAFSCLELALREQYGEKVANDEKYVRKGLKPTFRPLLRYAIDNGYIRNEGFSIWHKRAEMNSIDRLHMEKMQELNEKKLESIDIDESEARLLKEDYNWDYTAILLEALPTLRNHYAHGSATLHNQVIGSVGIVCEIINQIYQKNN
jgi:hypothetical protein